LLVKTYVWQALLRLKDYSVLPAVADFFDAQPEPPRELYMPRDRLLHVQNELANEIGGIHDPRTVPFLERFARSEQWLLRMNALQSLRAINSPHSAATFLKELDDSNSDNAFSAMHGLLALAGGGRIDWVPSLSEFRNAPQFYATKCREWWYAEGQRKAAAQSATSTKQPF
jgi:HEAT repeat protein